MSRAHMNGIQAIDAFEALGVEPPEVKPGRNFIWLRSDRHAFEEAAYLDDSFMREEFPTEITVTMAREVRGHLADWRAALPYSEAERSLVFDTDRFGGFPELVRAIGRVQLLDSGVEREVSGRELMQRWFKWRRGADQYEGTNGVNRARTALYGIAAVLLPADQLPPVDS